MKNHILKLLFTIILVIGTSSIFAQVPPPPPGGHGTGGNVPAGGTGSITGGIGILLALGAAYGGKKVYKAWKDKDQIED